jgi:hypothetical protein
MDQLFVPHVIRMQVLQVFQIHYIQYNDEIFEFYGKEQLEEVASCDEISNVNLEEENS